MNIYFKQATANHAEIIGAMVVELTREICNLTHTQHFAIDLQETIQQSAVLIEDGHYSAVVGFLDGEAIALATMSQTYALYAGGKVAQVQEFYVAPEYRTTGIGSLLLEQVKEQARLRGCVCIELCTPPLPEFERSVTFYQKNGLKLVGGRKMRLEL